ncbi:unnamed protein product [Caenorhabditis sp. 36 PRJEB53466]|nr:unnamed protein product [Caenorhabditis sp. 36 PRJEB53466]
MGNLKEDLKAAAGLLKTGDNEKVIELLEEYTENESPDYRALCFVALAYSNTEDFDNSYRLYRTAVKIDEVNLMAWKGLFKLFETESLAKPDNFSLKVCEFMFKNGDDRKDAAAQARRRIHVELKMWAEILENFDEFQFGTDSGLLKQFIELQEQKELVERAFRALEQLGIFEKDGKVMLAWCKHEGTIGSVLKLVKQHSELIDDDFVQKKLLKHVCEVYFEQGTLPDVVSHVSSAPEPVLAVLKALRENDVPSALDALESAADRLAFPQSLLFVGLLAETENWNSVVEIIQSIRPSFVSPFCDGWLARSLLELDPDNQDRLKSFKNLPNPEFAVERLKLALKFDSEEVDRILNEFTDTSKLGIVLRLTKVLFHKKSILSAHVELADRLLKDGSAKDLVLAAEIRISAGLDANSLLVKAAKLNVRCSRAFFLLGKAISTKNPAKARSLIERAVSIRPECEEYVRVLDEVLRKQNASMEDRLEVLKTFIAKRKSRQKPFWLADALSTIHMSMNNLSEAIDELQQMVRLYKDHKSVWARLADVYTRKGHLRAAVSSYAQLAEMDGGHEFSISMIRVLLQLREFEDALQKITDFRQKVSDLSLKLCADSVTVLDFTEAEIRLNLHETTCGEAKKAHLKEALRLLTRCVGKDGECKYASVFKLLGDVLLNIGRYAKRILPYFEVEKAWEVFEPIDSISKAASFYMTVLRSRERDALAWYDVSVALLAKFKLQNDSELLSKVQKMLEHALSLTSIESLLSSIWTLLSETLRLAEHPVSHQLHCLSRALQLNKANDTAWLRLAVLCLEVGQMELASRVIDQTIKYNPYNADAWCAWAQHAHFSQAAHDAQAMFRQALSIRPTPAAVIGYSQYLCQSLKKQNNRFDSATAALDIEPVLDVKDLYSADENVLYHLGLLADLFGCYPQCLECYQLCHQKEPKEEIERALIKVNVLHPDGAPPLSPTVAPANNRIAGMFSLCAFDFLSYLTAEVDIYRELFDLIETGDADMFKKLYTKKVKLISVPLFISGIITNQMKLPLEFVRTMHDALPRHELIDYYPPVLPDGMDNGLRHLEQDGEEPFRYRHRSAHNMLEELRRLRQLADEERTQSQPTTPEDEQFQFLQI